MKSCRLCMMKCSVYFQSATTHQLVLHCNKSIVSTRTVNSKTNAISMRNHFFNDTCFYFITHIHTPVGWTKRKSSTICKDGYLLYSQRFPTAVTDAVEFMHPLTHTLAHNASFKGTRWQFERNLISAQKLGQRTALPGRRFVKNDVSWYIRPRSLGHIWK